MISSARNINQLWASLIVEELVRSEVDQFVLAPGSRSTPLVVALAQNPRAHKLVHFDERSTAFYALGIARATGRPAAWITTSGTAVANGLPAAVEAAQDGVPLLLITADRPPELRSAGANQAIDQQKIFGDYVRWYFDLPAPDERVDPRATLTTIDQAVHRARTNPPGPVHLNCMFREPLAPVEISFDAAALEPSLARWSASDRPLTEYHRPDRSPSDASIDALATSIGSANDGILIVGRTNAADDRASLRELIRVLDWPVMADVMAPIRFDPEVGGAIVPHDLLLASSDVRERLRPRVVLRLGAEPVSRRLTTFVREAAPSLHVVVRDGPERTDSTHSTHLRFDCSEAAFCRALAARLRRRERGFAGRWETAASRAKARLRQTFAEQGPEVSEPWVSWVLPGLLPPESGLFLGNSMPVRDVDAFGFGDGGLVVAGNRGASGIDGTLSTAIGFCRGLDRTTTVLLGDLALLHDLNALAMCGAISQPFPIVVINNDGGGIFSFLEIGGFPDFFEPYFGTPHGFAFENAAALFGLPYAAPKTREEFSKDLAEALCRTGPTLIEVRTSREANRDLHRSMREAIQTELREAWVREDSGPATA